MNAILTRSIYYGLVSGFFQSWTGGDFFLGSVSFFTKSLTAPWRRGYAEACKALYPGSSPGGASIGPGGGMVDTRDLKSLALNRRAGSIPALGTTRITLVLKNLTLSFSTLKK